MTIDGLYKCLDIIYNDMKLPFFAMEEAKENDINDILNKLKLQNYGKNMNEKFNESVVIQLKLQGMHSALSNMNKKTKFDANDDDIKNADVNDDDIDDDEKKDDSKDDV